MSKRILGVDFGDARTGLALSDLTGFLASGAGTIKGGFETTAKAVADFAIKNDVGKIVLGHPINMNGTLGERSEKIKAFASRLFELCEIEVELFDERLSTANAHQILNITNTRGEKRKRIIDEMSACLILQSYLDRERAKK
ncbi:MAG: Holliday junction resolvase RuvX [Clostridia bacterium]|nr:Holliday junction resolvase RuvX [Clostridia bacterium]MBR2296745.1 Holliday junction resolvase RuvX [Clostridia bacterium]